MCEDPLNPDDPFLRLENQNIALQLLVEQYNRNVLVQTEAMKGFVRSLGASFHAVDVENSKHALRLDNVDNDIHRLDVDLTKLRNYAKDRFDNVDRRFDDIDIWRTEMDAWRGNVDQRFDQVDQRFDEVDKRFDQVDERFEAVDRRFDDIDTWRNSADQRFESIDTKLDAVLAAVGGNT